MKKFIIGILIGFVAIFCLNEISDKKGQLSSSVLTVTEQYADDAEHTCELSSHSRQTLANEWRFSFEELDAVNLRRDDTSLSSSSGREGRILRNLKFASTILMLSFYDVPLTIGIRKFILSLLFREIIVRYFVYTLRKIII
ncbi:MAG: hypothetical protein ACLU4N_26970 [Butyricimonas faecihominis]